jgi:hypothetical protein
MKSKRLLQIFVLLVLLVSPMSGVQAHTAALDVPRDATVINRNLNFWDATYIGFVSDSLFEKWRFEFTGTHTFVLTVSPLTGGFVPLLTLMDANDNVLATGVSTLASTQPAGTYYIQVQPESGSGFYFLTIREIVNSQPSVSTSVNPTSLNVGENATVTVSLNNVPPEGYTSAEFTCTYNPAFLSTSNVVIGNLFGADAASAINVPQAGTFIVAIAGSNGAKATTSGPVFTFTVTALQPGQTSIECTVRVSKGDNVLTPLPSTAADLTITGSLPTPTDTAPAETPTPTTDPNATETPAETSTPSETSTPDGTTTPEVTATPEESPTPTSTSTPEPTNTPEPSPTATALPAGSLNGQVIAGKPVTVSLYDAGDNLVATVPANPDGTFALTAPAGTYVIVATADGFLSAAGVAVVTSGGATTMPNVALLAGDIDGNDVIDQFDALTIGMSYNTDSPAAADLNNDGVINVLDLELLAGNYRATGPSLWQ